jgi:hypothetical protein
MFNLDDIIGNVIQEANAASVPGSIPTSTTSTAPSSKIGGWWKNVVKSYNQANPGQVLPTNTDKPVGEVASSIASILNSSPSITPEAYKLAYLPIVDLCKSLFTIVNTTLGISKTDIDNFTRVVQSEYEKPNSAIANKINEWLKRGDLDYTKYTPADPIISRAERVREKQIDDLGDVALSTLDGLCILPATQEVINRRTSAVERVIAFKGPKAPFGNLLYDIFNDTSAYVAGLKPISNDFEKIVHGGLYISEIIKTAVYARLFYESIKCRPLPPPPSGGGGTPTPPGGPGTPTPPGKPGGGKGRGKGGGGKKSTLTQAGIGQQGVIIQGNNNRVTQQQIIQALVVAVGPDGELKQYSGPDITPKIEAFIKNRPKVIPEKPPTSTTLETSSLTLNDDSSFSILIESILNEVAGIPSIPGAGILAYIKDIPANVINYLKQIRKDNEFMDFVKRGIAFLHDCEKDGSPLIIDMYGKPEYVMDLTTGKPAIFNLKLINTMSAKNQSAKDLMNVFARIAQYQREGSGALERTANVGAAAGSLAAIGGVKSGFSM